MNEWLLAALGFFVLLLGAGLLTLRGPLLTRIVAMQLSSTLATLAMVVLAQGQGRDVYFDLAIVTSVMSFVGTLFYVRAVDAWL